MSIPHRIGVLLERTLPAFVVTRLKALYSLYYKRTVCRLNRRLLTELAPTPASVQHGPFQGMRYGDVGCVFETVAKWLGSYEMELHEHIEALCRLPYATVINIGCAEGYYAVGLARRFSQARVFAFDIDHQARAQCTSLAAANGVSPRVTIAGQCTTQNLNNLIQGRTLIVCDCEGAERELLDPAKAPRLTQADLLVEVHDFVDPAISSTLLARFRASHTVERIPSQPRTVGDFSALDRLNPRHRQLAIEEFRPGPMEWFILLPLTPGSDASSRRGRTDTKP